MLSTWFLPAQMVFSTSLQPWATEEWPEIFATSAVLQPRVFLAFRGCLAITFLGHQLAHLGFYVNLYEWAYGIYLTNWTLLLQTVSECLLFALALQGSRRLSSQNSPSSNSMPKVIPFAVVLWSIVQPMSMVVTLLYFALQNPIWNLRPMRYLAIFPHLVNWILLLLSLLLSRVPFNLSHVGWPMLFAATYVAWSVVHFFLKIGKNEPCEVYPINDCPIYNTFDWHHPQKSVPILFAALTGTLLVSALYSKLVHCRDSCAKSRAQTRALCAASRENGDVELCGG
ncbi:unnamed protein product [Durusdinium trenchii]|uniref:Uncharacterized protein n=1 Tax=Durusdinium trenchii TaxID=1381693 RepID=A0ABP0SWX9_9DINO